MKKPDQEETVKDAEKQEKKAPVIIELTNDELDSVVGAGRCPPVDIGHMIPGQDKPTS